MQGGLPLFFARTRPPLRARRIFVYNRYMDSIDLLKKAWRGVPAEFESAFGMEESVRRLHDATGRNTFCVLGKEEAVGTVTQNAVSLRRAIPMAGNSFKPFFTGRFEERGGKVYLTGHFAMHRFAKIGLAAWFGFLFCILLMGAVSGTAALALFGGGLLMTAAGAAIVMLGRWFARNDTQWLSDVMRRALEARRMELSAAQSTGEERGPVSLTLFIFMIAVLGVVTMVAGRASARDYTLGLLLLFFAWGAWRRMPLAWAAGLGLFACATVAAITTIPHRMAQMGDAPRAAVIVFDMASVLIAGWWTFWWYNQRRYFNE